MFVFKFVLKDDTRRLALDTIPSYQTLVRIASNLFLLPPDTPFNFYYKDEEGDAIKVASDIEFDEAVRQTSSQILKFYLVIEGESSPLRSEVPRQPVPETAAQPSKKPETNPQPRVSPSARLRVSQITRDLNILNALEKQLAVVFRNLSMFMGGEYAVKEKIVNIARDCHQALGSFSSGLTTHLLDPLANFASTHTSGFHTELSKLKSEIGKLRTELEQELRKVGDKQQELKDSGKPYFAPLLALRNKNLNSQESAPVEAQLDLSASAFSDHEISKLLEHFQILNNNNNSAGEQADEPPAKYKEALATLNEMGFVNNERNIELLNRYRGDVTQVVDKYLAA